MKRKIIFFIFILSSTFNSLNSKIFEFIPGSPEFYNPFSVVSNDKYAALLSTDYTFTLVNDTLTGVFNSHYLAKYYNYKWNIIDSNLQQMIFDGINDEELKKDKLAKDIVINKITNDINNNYWYTFSLKKHDELDLVYFHSDEKKLFFKEYYDKFLDKLRFIRGCDVFFDNNNIPYFIMWKNSIGREENYSICKLDGDTLKTIFTSSVPASGGYHESNSNNHKLLFDSKNNFWTYAEDKIYYFVNDTINKEYSTWEITKLMDPPHSRGIQYLFLYNDLPVLINTDFTITSLIEDKWQVDYDFKYYVESIQPIQLFSDKPIALIGKSKLALYINDIPNYLMIKDLEKNSWSMQLIQPKWTDFLNIINKNLASNNTFYRLFIGDKIENNLFNWKKLIYEIGIKINLEDE